MADPKPPDDRALLDAAREFFAVDDELRRRREKADVSEHYANRMVARMAAAADQALALPATSMEGVIAQARMIAAPDKLFEAVPFVRKVIDDLLRVYQRDFEPRHEMREAQAAQAFSAAARESLQQAPALSASSTRRQQEDAAVRAFQEKTAAAGAEALAERRAQTLQPTPNPQPRQ